MCSNYPVPGQCPQWMEELILQINLALIFLLILSNHSQLDLAFQNVDSYNLPNHNISSQYFHLLWFFICRQKISLNKLFLLYFGDKCHGASTFPRWLFSLWSAINYLWNKINYLCNVSVLKDKEDVNFVVDSWDNIFLKLCISEQGYKDIVESAPVRAWKDGRTLHITSPNSLPRAESLC